MVNDIFNTMKSIYGLPPKDGIISCRIMYDIVVFNIVLHYLMDMKMIWVYDNIEK